ncbi:MAG: hypothetical protein EI684_07370 [Candidatus Viridilinea halotolerans]|uniref:Uncharacterized protein n=1 Tax=Candidatus Viridilinea halotolerans TaxID=2491704 RepID=A0A426U3G6_9CHLR|nr:MAG: hypothetical protein EI684_07370 [Candidatus Viridilinea halotolerans]
MMRTLLGKVGYIFANMVVMVILHGNSKQFWPKIPVLSLRDESIGEHVRLLFNTIGVTTVGQAAIGKLPRERWLARALTMGVVPSLLPAIILFGQKILRLKGQRAEIYNLAMVPLLPVAAVVIEDALVGQIIPPPADHAA